MAVRSPMQTTLLPGGRALLAAHARELPQRDDLCGAFCAALALRAAGIERMGSEPLGEPLDQDAVALAAGSVVAAAPDAGHLPHGEPGRRDYRLALPTVDDAEVSGTTAAGVAHAIETLSGSALVAIPFSGPWSATTLGGLFDAAASLEHPATLIANLATRHLWGGRARLDQLLDHLYDGELSGPPPDWEVGHFVCVFGCVRGPRGTLYGVADTYAALGHNGVHAQPAERLAAAIERRDMPAGGLLAVVAAADAEQVRAAAAAAGLREGLWDNGTVTVGAMA
ncbi:MAG TPA: hypothetical protein VNV42_16775 [Solirubrobacteraceae bacterium]|nr:hypothetical protein [Solirubrobacteraceae bacterium]